MAPVTQRRTSAETALVEAASVARGAAAPIAARDAASALFGQRGLPSRRVEAWHYTDLRRLMADAYPIAKGAPAPMRGQRIELVDGVAPADLAAHAWPAGLRIRALRDVLAMGDASLLARLFPEQGSGDAVVALNAAVAADGVVIEVEPGARIDGAIEIHFASGGDAPRADFSRLLAVVGAGASLTLVESHDSAARVQRNNALVLDVGPGASVEHVFMTGDHRAEVHVATLIAELAEGARFHSFGLIDGGAVLRRQSFVRCAGENVELALRGVSLLSGKQHADNTIVVDHAVPHGQSRELFKHIVAGEATGVFQGKVIVRPHAQKVDGGMKSQTLLISEDAAVYNKPELEIFADDVVCGHGATIGQIDADQLFYLMARGLPRARAEALLLEGFAREAIEFVAHEPTRERLETALAAWLDRRA